MPARHARKGSIDAAPRAGVPARIAGLDALRGAAIAAMVAYHFAFDLALFRVARLDFERDPFWLAARAAILSTFLCASGISLVLARLEGVSPAKRWRRIAQIAACALAVSAASWLAFPRTWIWFGVLHAIAAAGILAWPFTKAPRAALACGIAVIAAGLALSHPAFDTRSLGWIGFATRRPPTEDYVPLFPWLGVVLVGVWLGHELAKRSFAPLAPLARAPAAVRWMGRHSLAVYMVHQPLIIGALAAALGRWP
jgi:uncharacterized membrane protein